MYRRECRSQCTKKAERMKKVFTSSLVYFRFVLWRIKLLSTCSRARITSMQIWLRLSFQNHHIHKSQCVCVILFAWNRTSNCDKYSGKYSPIRRTQTLTVIFSRNEEFLEKNGAPYNRITTVNNISRWQWPQTYMCVVITGRREALSL